MSSLSDLPLTLTPDSTELLQTIYDRAPIGIAMLDPGTGCFLWVNKTYCRATGRSRQDLLSGLTVADITPPEDLAAEAEHRRKLIAGEIEEYRIEKRYIRRDGTTAWCDVSVSLVRGDNGSPHREIRSAQDVTERRHAEEALRESEARLRLALQAAEAGTWEWDAVNDRMTWSEEYYDLLCHSPGTVEPSLSTWIASVCPEDRDRISRVVSDTLNMRREEFEVEFRVPHPVLGIRWLLGVGRAEYGSDGTIRRAVGLNIDITRRRAAEQALRESDKRLQLALDAGQIGTFEIQLRTGVLEADERARALWGLPPEQPLTLKDAFAGMHPKDRERVQAAMAASRAPGAKGPDELEYRVISAEDGVERYVMARRRVEFEDGVAVRSIGTVLDVTAQRRAAEVLSRDKAELERLVEERTAALLQAGEEREGLKERVRRTERMDALGKLTGGVAHDFNNLLTAVIGGAEEILDSVPEGHPLREPAEAVLAAADRGAALTKQLLVFARGRPLQLREMNVTAAVTGMEAVLRRAAGASAELRFRYSDGALGAIAHVDPVQLETAVLNLVVNARDAMPGGGRVTITTGMIRLDEHRAEVQPGDYVCISVEDTGSGMPPDVVARACEPFFTTKPEGQGTGLGLSMAYGFARQSGGCVEIESGVGRGTTVRILLPRCGQRSENATAQESHAPRGTGQRLLLVEDDPLVRKQTEEQVRSLGYQVESAADGRMALAALRADLDVFDVVLTDLSMPGGVSGWALAQAIRVLRPGLPVVLCTGYSDEALQHELAGQGLEPDWPLLRKPYRRAELARALHAATGAG
jgi:PAS domain S-box-containing protein